MKPQSRAKIANCLLEMQYTLSEPSMNLLGYLLQRAYIEEVNLATGAPIVIVDRNKLIDVAQLKKNGGRLGMYLDELQREYFKSEIEQVTISAPMISAYIWHRETDMISIEFSRLLWPLLSDVVKNFTVFDLVTLWKITGKYAKRFYLDVMRWSNRGGMKLSIDNLQARYDTQYNYNDIIRRIVEPGIKQIGMYTNLTVTPLEHTKRGKKVITLNFHINKPDREALEPLAEKLTMRYGVNAPYARLIVNSLSYRDIVAVLESIDKNRLKIKNIGAYTAEIFKHYGLTDYSKKKPQPEPGVNDNAKNG